MWPGPYTTAAATANIESAAGGGAPLPRLASAAGDSSMMWMDVW